MANFGFEPENDSRKSYYFISYSSEDAETVKPILQVMHKLGLSMWYDKLRSGEVDEQIKAKVISNRCQKVIMFISQETLQKEKSYVIDKEYEWAREAGKEIVPVVLGTIDFYDIDESFKAHKEWLIDDKKASRYVMLFQAKGERKIAFRFDKMQEFVPVYLKTSVSLVREILALIKYPIKFCDQTKDGVGYKGEVDIDGNFCGKGVFTYRNGDVYNGEFAHGKYNGEGRLEWKKEKVIFEGIFVKEIIYGTRTSMVYGDKYEGCFSDYKYDGKGKLVCKNGSVYEGEFKKGLAEFKGIMTCADGSVCDGIFKNNLTEFEGSKKCANGDFLEGFFKNGKHLSGKAVALENGKSVEYDVKNGTRKKCRIKEKKQ